ncbi:MAG: CocE/NonD family hydrolase [Steroidobacteraceae bacterium]
MASDRENTDIFVSLSDVHPDGRSIELGGKGQLRLSHRDGMPPKPLMPNEVTQIRIEANWVHHAFQPGHRIRIAISSSGYPYCARNPGTFTSWADDTVLLPQTNSVHHGGAYRSRVILPVISEKV